MGEIVELLRETDANWDSAIANLRALQKSHGAKAEADAAGFVSVYDGCRRAMIVDVVASRQRRYHQRVAPMVADWKAANTEHSIAALAGKRLDASQFGLAGQEVDTIAIAAQRFRKFAAEEGITDPDDEDRLCRLWADRYEPFEHAPKLDPVVGSVKGIGPALWSYMRMRSGADAIKIDVRVKKSLRRLGFAVPPDDHAALIIAKASARELGISLLVLDQLLWAME